MGKRAKAVWIIFVLLAPIFSKKCESQYLFSTVSNGTGAFLASSMKGQSFVGNPAFLGIHSNNKNIFLLFDSQYYPMNYGSIFDPNFPDFEIWIPAAYRFTFSIKKQFHFPIQYLHYFFDNYYDLPEKQIPGIDKKFAQFNFRQDWSYGLGFSKKPNLSFGICAKHSEYFGTNIKDEYISVDIASLYKIGSNFSIAFDFQNIFSRKVSSISRHYFMSQPDTGKNTLSYWDLSQWHGLQIKPKQSVTLGVSYSFLNHFESMFDWSSRKEFSLGLRVILGKYLSIFSGMSDKYNQIYDKEKIKVFSLGCQIHYSFIIFTISGILPQEYVYKGRIVNQYGYWNYSYYVSKKALFSFGFYF